MRAALLALFLAAPSAGLAAEISTGTPDYPLPAPPETPHLNFTADHFDYDSSSGLIHLMGHVLITESTPAAHVAGAAGSFVAETLWNLKADELWLNAPKREIRSEGYMVLEDGYSAVYGDRADFNYETHQGFLNNPKAAHGDFQIYAKRVDVGQGGRLDYRSADFTGCDLYPKPHYHFHSSHLVVIPKKRLYSTNTLLYIGPIPVFYTPILFKSLKPRHWLHFKLQPGYDRRNGGYLKTTLLTQYGPTVYSKLYLDYFNSQGVGTGAELQRRKGEDSRAALYGYQINENRGSHSERWALLGDAYQGLVSSVSFQGRFQLQSDAEFNNNYARSSLFRVTPELVNSAALVYRTRKVTARLSYARDDRDDGSGIRYLKQTESTPRVDFQTAQLEWWRLPWLNTLTGFADNNFDVNRGFQQRSMGAGWEGTRTIPIVHDVSLTPRVGYSETYLSEDEIFQVSGSTDRKVDVIVGRYTLEGTLRVGSPVGTWDLKQNYVRRLKDNAITDAGIAIDHGIESNLMSLEDAFRPARNVLGRVSAGYDFRKFRDHDLSFRERVQPIVAEGIYTPRQDWNFSVRNDYQLAQGNRSFIASATKGEPGGTYVSGGLSFNLADPHSTFVNNELGWRQKGDPDAKPGHEGEGWRLSAALRSQFYSEGGLGHVTAYRLFEKEFTVAKNMHDFYVRAMARFRPGGVKEGFFRLDMKIGAFTKEVARRDWESEWFPERASGIEDRP